jgi:hypothetical protein
MKKHSFRAIFALLLMTTIPAISWVSSTNSHLKFFDSAGDVGAEKSIPASGSAELFVQHVNFLYTNRLN